MLLTDKPLYSLDDVTIIPAGMSEVAHRSECLCRYFGDKSLPIFTAPMSTLVNKDNVKTFEDGGIIPVIPRNISIVERMRFLKKEKWVSFSLEEASSLVDLEDEGLSMKVLIDVANGNMISVDTVIRRLKERYGDDITIMAGNVANPMSYKNLSDAGADYVRISVGSGSACTTAVNTGIFYPMASLIDECSSIYRTNVGGAKIIADGGIRCYRDMIKCLALGAHYVMLGYALAELKDEHYVYGMKKPYYGMASEEGQKDLGKSKIGIPEGKHLDIRVVNKDLKQFTSEFTAYLQSAMSYCNCRSLEEFTSNVNIGVLGGKIPEKFME